VYPPTLYVAFQYQNLIETRWVVSETKHWDHRRKDIYPFHALILCTLCKEWSEVLETMNVLQSVERKSQICYRRTGSSGSITIKTTILAYLLNIHLHNGSILSFTKKWTAYSRVCAVNCLRLQYKPTDRRHCAARHVGRYSYVLMSSLAFHFMGLLKWKKETSQFHYSLPLHSYFILSFGPVRMRRLKRYTKSPFRSVDRGKESNKQREKEKQAKNEKRERV
jgi:hypothetical protein